MSMRLEQGGRLIDREKTLGFVFDSNRLSGFAGDTLASALLGAGKMLVNRSYKYHRPRGIVASGPEEPNALVGLGQGARFEPDQRATTTELFDGLTAMPQNAWPSLGFDAMAVNGWLSKFMPAGFYYKTFIWPRPFWKHVYEPFIREAAASGRPPQEPDADKYEHFYAFVDVLIVGGGIAGLQAALTAGKSGARVLLMEQTAHWGGRAPVDGAEIEGKPADSWIAETLAALEAMENVTLRTRTMGAGVFDHGYALGYERVADHTPGDGRVRHRLWRIRAKQILTATGAIERPLSFAGNDVPGVMLASAVRDYVVNYGVAPGRKVVVVTNNDDAYRTALALIDAGLEVPVVVDARERSDGPLAREAMRRGVAVECGAAIMKVKGKKRVEGVMLCRGNGTGGAGATVECDAVAMSGGWSPVVHLWSHCGGKLLWSEENAHFYPNFSRAPTGAQGEAFVRTAGIASGAMGTGSVLKDAAAAAADACGAAGFAIQAEAAQAVDAEERPMKPVWVMPEQALPELRSKMFLDFQNDVKVADIQLAAQEGYESVELTKRYTTLGMANDQGKLSNINGLAILANSLGAKIPQVGTTTFRPPYQPISFGSIAGEARGATFQPLRRTPMHDWHERNGAYWEPVGHWRRPYCYPKPGEDHDAAVAREVLATRNSLGLLDASTLGKLVVKGPDAGRFLDMLYTNKMSTLKPGKCRYGLMCNENGFLSDDGVVARIDEDTFLCHTTSGGADRIHGWMEDWLQTEWWDWKVYVANVTEQWGQIAVVGPNARKLLEKLGGMDVSKEALPFMGWAEGELDGIKARIFRISFSGELSYEIAVPAGEAMTLWGKLLAAGREWSITPYGTEALHIMRAEKGFIMIGDETDGTVIPQDLGLGWAISKKKDDYLGKRAQERSHMVSPDRWKLVGLETLDGSVLPDGAYAVGEGVNGNGQRNTIGRVTSTYRSPTLGKGIAMGLVHHGPDRMGEVIKFVATDESVIEAKIVSPVFYDPDGEKQDV
ncbi:sarcosine oxidase subunit alpha family protein [Aliiruegeria sabulilitoris]|uniref:sarcosine oxidase subunit alpha family protein n=1 Tax=Aliiruegeria sabulilitoris TaxID=1510458 RepID=UPI00082BB821|nr:sarcosine oxidase subunit alpha family protein [Aliiruegeria sabulilitoris]NDR55289.1 sarcosine oxidase subunit alpha family protein [Pseudoruegeria sp. M32A2M]